MNANYTGTTATIFPRLPKSHNGYESRTYEKGYVVGMWMSTITGNTEPANVIQTESQL